MGLHYFGRYFFIILAVIVLFTIGDVWIIYQSIQEVRSTSALVERSKNVTLNLQKMTVSFLLASVDQRAYLLTQDEAARTRYKAAIPTITATSSKLKDLVNDDASQTNLVGELARDMSARIANFDSEIVLLATDGFPAVQSHMRITMLDTNETIIRSLISTIESNENIILKHREDVRVQSYLKLYITVAFGGLLSLSFTLLIAYLVARELRRRNASERNKDDFISIVSHELKTPITSMSVFAQILERESKQEKKDKKIVSYIRKIQDQISRQKALIDDLSDISKLKAGEFNFEKEDFDFNVLIKDIVEVVQTTTKTHKIVIKGKINRLVHADKERINQVLINFLSNAIKYSPSAKNVTVLLHPGRLAAKISVVDNGIGIPKDQQRQIFKRFYRIQDNKKHFPGLGLGLFISSEIIHRHGGSVNVQSSPNKGSTFSFTLPYVKKVYQRSY